MQTLPETPLLIYPNMPKSAQMLPFAHELPKDKGVCIEVYQCPGCGLIQLTNQPVPYFREVIRAAGVSDEMKAFRLKQFSRFFEKYQLSGRKCIEIGCGYGEYLILLQQAGADAYGIEFADDAVNNCRNNKLNVCQGFIDRQDFSIQDSPFSAFFILNFLEHLPDPLSSLKGICNNLEPGGHGMVEVPNFDMIVDKKLFSEFTVDHLFYFTEDTLRTTLALGGFEVLECNTVWYDYIICAHVRKRAHTDLALFSRQNEKLQRELNLFLDAYTPEQIAVWGAGHQALAVLSLFDLSARVGSVIDSAPFKQNRYTPATHIKIVSPKILDSKKIKVIIVMAASYTDEVCRIIKANYGERFKIAALRENCLERIQ